MTEEEIIKFNSQLIELLSQESGLFGRVNSYGQIPENQEYTGYTLSEDFLPILRSLSEKKRKTLAMVMIYFEMHMRPLRKLLDWEAEKWQLYRFYSEIAWSHFATLVMFGMLEIAIKEQRGVHLKSKGFRIREFLEKHLPSEKKTDIAKRYKVDELFNTKPITDFGSVIDHMWFDVRGGFVHDAGVQHRGMEWSTLEGIGTRERPLRVEFDVPMQEFLQITWEAILHSFGYNGTLELAKIK